MIADALLAAVRAHARRLTRRDATTCRCAHSAAAHTHNRRGHDCGACGPAACRSFRAQKPRIADVELHLLIAGAWQQAAAGDRVSAERLVARIAERGSGAMWALLADCAQQALAAGGAPPSYHQYAGDLAEFAELLDAEVWAAEFVRGYGRGEGDLERIMFEALHAMDQHERAVALLQMAVRAALADTRRRG